MRKSDSSLEGKVMVGKISVLVRVGEKVKTMEDGSGVYHATLLNDVSALDKDTVIELGRMDLEPVHPEYKKQINGGYQILPETEAGVSPLRQFMDTYGISRREMTRILQCSPPKAHNTMASPRLSLNTIVLLRQAFEFQVKDVDPDALVAEQRDPEMIAEAIATGAELMAERKAFESKPV